MKKIAKLILCMFLACCCFGITACQEAEPPTTPPPASPPAVEPGDGQEGGNEGGNDENGGNWTDEMPLNG